MHKKNVVGILEDNLSLQKPAIIASKTRLTDSSNGQYILSSPHSFRITYSSNLQYILSFPNTFWIKGASACVWELPPEICESLDFGGPLNSSYRDPKMVRYCFFDVHLPPLPETKNTRDYFLIPVKSPTLLMNFLVLKQRCNCNTYRKEQKQGQQQKRHNSQKQNTNSNPRCRSSLIHKSEK